MQISVVTVIVALLLLGGAVKGFKNGIVKEVSSFIALTGALAAVILFALAVENYRTKDTREMIIAVISFIVVILAYKVIDFIMTSLKLLSRLPVISWFDHLAGAAAGAGEGVLITWIAFLIITAYNFGGLRSYLFTCVGSDPLLEFLFRNNFIARLIAGLSVWRMT